MADENQTTEESGIGNILDRLETQLNEASGACLLYTSDAADE